MVFIERYIISEITKQLEQDFPNKKIIVSNDNINAKSTFPVVTVVQSDTFQARNFIDSSGKENVCDVTFDINVYSNDKHDPVGECIALLQSISKLMISKNMTCITTIKMESMNNNSIHRYVQKYIGRVAGQYLFTR
jgi:hypothetical protein